MKKIILTPLFFATLLACAGGGGEPADGSRYDYVKQNTRGFEALVDGAFTLPDMQNTFGNYCARNNKVMRSLRMEPADNGKKRVIGDCL